MTDRDLEYPLRYVARLLDFGRPNQRQRARCGLGWHRRGGKIKRGRVVPIGSAVPRRLSR